MPVINTQGFPAIASVRVQVDWSDVPAATYATVWRVDCTTGERTQLRPYVAYNQNGYLLLSCGVATFWDTEVPLDTCVFYCTQAHDSSGTVISTATNAIVSDNFNRTNVDTWNTATSGQVWTLTGGTVGGNYDVTGTKGTQTNDTVNVLRQSTLDTRKTGMVVQANVSVNAVTTGANGSSWLLLNGADLSNYYTATLAFVPAGTVSLSIGKRQAGSLVLGASTGSLGSYAADTEWTIKAEALGSQIRAKAWLATDPEPFDWTLTLPTSALTTQGTLAGLLSRRDVGNTNASLIFSWDNFAVFNPCDLTQTVEVCSGNVTVASSGNLWLKDPVRPCNDQKIVLCWTPDPTCVEGQGIFFARMETESYPSNTNSLQPVNARHPIPVVRQRGDTESTMVLVTRSFADRDELLTELEPGSPLLLQAPATYGLPDRYVSVGDAGVARYHPDHRYQPRVFTLPFVTVDRPAGPSQGICGARVDDLCGTYTSWNAMITAGLTYQDLIDGKASPNGPGVSFRTWLQIETTYASWLAVETAPNTWETVREG